MKIENYLLIKNIRTLYIPAVSFPAGVTQAHEQLHVLLPSTANRNFFGISRPNQKGEIIYFAAVEESVEGEAEKFNCKSLILKSGNYISVFLSDYEKNIQDVSEIFMKLLQDPRIDPQGYCVEVYLGEKDMRCMVRLKD